ncbi:ferredoxin [Streptomyces sp. SP18CS02]|uniref:ferredoxin n=1 Tax=Streptomyces sp. SP18CS02 TaxID=3002531 RepID=UPI002E774A78|nr:ferredoxin [Streptomyces sp. SP18CS02]MEE1755246.1 ferredoxin [Streptomyces sp. SP18CS02]
MDVRVDRDRCIGAGMCALTAPQVFDQDDDEGLVVLLDTRPPREQHAAVRIVTGVCPASAVSVTATATATATATEQGSSPAS